MSSVAMGTVPTSGLRTVPAIAGGRKNAEMKVTMLAVRMLCRNKKMPAITAKTPKPEPKAR